jgi:hypothetical protein
VESTDRYGFSSLIIKKELGDVVEGFRLNWYVQTYSGFIYNTKWIGIALTFSVAANTEVLDQCVKQINLIAAE